MFASLKWSCFLLIWTSGIFSQPLLQNAADLDIDLVAEESDASAQYARVSRSPNADYDFHRFHGFHGHDHGLHGHHHYHHGHGSGEFHPPNCDFHPHAHGWHNFDNSFERDHPGGLDSPHAFDLHQGHRHYQPFYSYHELETKAPQTDQRHPLFSHRFEPRVGEPSTVIRQTSTTPQPSPAFLPTSSSSLSLPTLPSSSYTTTTTIASSSSSPPSSSSRSPTTSTAMPDKTEANDLEYNIDLRFGD